MCEEAVYDVVALGELLIDFTPVSTDGAGCPTLKANPGGAPGNLLAALSRYGRRTAFLGKVGEDAFGRLLLESLRRAGVQTRGIRLTSSAFTTLAFVTLDAAGDRSFSFARKPGADTQLRWEEVDRSLIQRCRLFHFGSLSLTDEPARSATRAAVAYARELGRTVTFDPNLRLPLWPSPAEARAQILWSLCQADVVKLSDEEVDFLWGCSPQEGARRLLDFRVPPEELDRGGLEEIARFAVTAASLSTQHPGGIPSIPELAQVVARMGEPAPLSL